MRRYLAAIMLTLMGWCGEAIANPEIRAIPCRAAERNNVFYILEGIGGGYPSPRKPSLATEELYDELLTVRNLLGVPDEVMVLVTDCPVYGHPVRTIRNPIVPLYGIYISQNVLPADTYERRQVARNEICLIRIGRASDNQRASTEDTLQLRICRLIVELRRTQRDEEAIRYLRSQLPPGTPEELPQHTAADPQAGLLHALRLLGGLAPGGPLSPSVLNEMRESIERLERSLTK